MSPQLSLHHMSQTFSASACLLYFLNKHGGHMLRQQTQFWNSLQYGGSLDNHSFLASPDQQFHAATKLPSPTSAEDSHNQHFTQPPSKLPSLEDSHNQRFTQLPSFLSPAFHKATKLPSPISAGRLTQPAFHTATKQAS